MPQPIASFFKRYALPFGSYAIGRGAVFFAPLILAACLPKSDYGLFEGLLSTAMLAGTIANLGMSAAIPYYTLHAPSRSKIRCIHAHVALGLTFLVALTAILLLLEADEVALGVGLAAHVAGQRVLSAHYSTLGNTTLAGLSAGYFYFLILIAGISGILGFSIDLSTIAEVLLLGLIPIAVWSWKNFSKNGSVKGKQWTHYKELIKFSLPILFFGSAIMAAINYVRIVAVPLIGAESLADYSIIFRIAAIPTVIFQFFLIKNYKKIYTECGKNIDTILCHMNFISAVTALISYSVIPLIPAAGLFPISTVEIFRSYGMAEAIFIMVLGWNASSCTESLVQRNRMALRCAVINTTIILALLCTSFVFYTTDMLDIELLAKIHAAAVWMVSLIHGLHARAVNTRLPLFLRVNIAMCLVAVVGCLL